MALQHTPDATHFWLTLSDGTETGFSFGEYLAMAAYHPGMHAIPEDE